MEHFIRIAFGIVTLFGLQMESVPLNTTKSINFVDFSINLTRNHVKCLPDSTFYSPENVKEQCITNALVCITKELEGTVKAECTDGERYINQALDSFDDLIKQSTPMTNSSECSCERWPQKPFHNFLDEVKAFLQLYETAARS